jgi:hypothetical protein
MRLGTLSFPLISSLKTRPLLLPPPPVLLLRFAPRQIPLVTADALRRSALRPDTLVR